MEPPRTNAARLLAVLAAGLATSAAADAKNVATVNATQIFGTVDPAKVNDYTEYMAGVNLYDGLTTLDGDGAIVPLLAESWEVSDDALTWTFTLKEGATFQDGSPVEAKDVAWSVDRLLSINQGPANLFEGVLKPGSTTAPDARTVRFELDKVYTPFLTTTPILFVIDSDLAKERGGDDEWAQAWIGDNSAGAGPFRLASWERGASMVLEKYDGYHLGWDGRSIDEVRFVVTSEEATVKALAASGELTMSSDSQALETYEAIGRMDGYRIHAFPTATNFYLKLNHQIPPTDDLNIRRAIAAATDYDTIREALLPGEPLAGPMAPTFADAYLDELELPVFDLDEAKRLVETSGYADSTPIPIEVMYVAGLAFEEEIGLLLKSNLDEIGFDVTLRPEPWNRMTELASDPSTTPAINQVFYGPTYPSPDSFFFPQYDSSAKGTWASMEWLENDEIDALIDEARGESDVDRQNEIYKELQRKLVDMQSDVFLLTQTSQVAMSECIDNFTWVPMQSFEYNFHTMKWACD